MYPTLYTAVGGGGSMLLTHARWRVTFTLEEHTQTAVHRNTHTSSNTGKGIIMSARFATQ